MKDLLGNELEKFWEFPSIPTEVWDELKKQQQISNEITGVKMDEIRMLMKGKKKGEAAG